jgi:hypothetical protein
VRLDRRKFSADENIGIASTRKKIEQMRQALQKLYRPIYLPATLYETDMDAKSLITARTESPAGWGIVDRLDRASDKPENEVSRLGAELNIGFFLWPSFPLLSLAGFCDALRHAADLGDQSRQLRCSWKLLGVADGTVEASCGVTVPVHGVTGSRGHRNNSITWW